MSSLGHISDTAKHAVDGLAIGAFIASLLDLLPAITALLTAVWVALRIVEAWQNVRLNHRKLRE